MKPAPLAGAGFLFVKSWIHAVYILLIQPLSEKLHGFAKTLEVDDLPLTQELDYIVHVWVITQPQDIIIGDPGFLLWYAQSFATIFILKFWNKRLISAILSLKYSYIFGFLFNWPV